MVALWKASAETGSAETGSGHGLCKHAICEINPVIRDIRVKIQMPTFTVTIVIISAYRLSEFCSSKWKNKGKISQRSTTNEWIVVESHTCSRQRNSCILALAEEKQVL